jgi:molybdopterin-guanine dinucleotide biosynthesis protein A
MRTSRDRVSALILAGGKATRLGGVDKREIVVDGRSIFDRLGMTSPLSVATCSTSFCNRCRVSPSGRLS